MAAFIAEKLAQWLFDVSRPPGALDVIPTNGATQTVAHSCTLTEKEIQRFKMQDVHNTRTGITPAIPPENITDFYVWRDEEMFPLGDSAWCTTRSLQPLQRSGGFYTGGERCIKDANECTAAMCPILQMRRGLTPRWHGEGDIVRMSWLCPVFLSFPSTQGVVLSYRCSFPYFNLYIFVYYIYHVAHMCSIKTYFYKLTMKWFFYCFNQNQLCTLITNWSQNSDSVF